MSNPGRLIFVVIICLISTIWLAQSCSPGTGGSTATAECHCPLTTGSYSDTARDGSSAEIAVDTCIAPPPCVDEADLDISSVDAGDLPLDAREQLRSRGKIYSVVDISPDDREWNPPIIVRFALNPPAPRDDFVLTILQWREAQSGWRPAGSATAEHRGDREAVGQINHTSLFALVDEEIEGVLVPDLVDLNVEQAVEDISAAELEIGDVTEEPSPREPGTVLRQDPPAGREVEPGTPVSLVIAAPGEEIGVTVPGVVGLNVEEAVAVIEESGLQLGRITDEPASEVEVDTVLEQEPRGGERVAPDTPVHLIVAAPSATPVAAFAAEPIEGAEVIDDGLIRAGCFFSIEFVNLSANAEEFFWDFGDGTTSTEENPAHQYERDSVGTRFYTVRLVAAGPSGDDEEVKADYIESQCVE
jgi:hypothetical protein